MNPKDKNIIIDIVEKSKILNNYSKRNNMSVKNETIKSEQNEIVDDISNEDIKNTMTEEPELNDDVMAVLKAKMLVKKAEQVKSEEKPVTIKIVEEVKRSVEFGVIGAGHCGSRIAQSFYELNYPAVCFNTASVDLQLIKIPESHKLLLNYTAGGAARDQNVGEASVRAYYDEINNLVSENLSDSHIFLFTCSLSGGSGSGAIVPTIELLSTYGKPIIVLAVLPMGSDDGKQNALLALNKLSKLLQDKIIVNLIVVDNSKLESMYSDVSSVDLFEFTNNLIAKEIDELNKYSASPSRIQAFDSMEFIKVLCDGQGMSIFGSIQVDNYSEITSLAESLINGLEKGLLADGFSLDQTRYAGIIFAANKNVIKSIPSSSINYAMSIVKETCPSASVFRGIYEDDSVGDFVKIEFIFSGLGHPLSRIEKLKTDSASEVARSKGRDEKRNLTLDLDIGEKNANAADQIKELIKNKSSVFNKNFVGIKDFRKK